MRNPLVRYALAGVVVAALVTSLGCGRRSVGSVNGNKITQEQFYKRLQRHPAAPNVPFPPPINQQTATVVLNQMITEGLLLDFAKQEGVEPGQKELDDRKKELNGFLSDRGRDLTTMLNQSGMSHKELDERLAPELAQSKVIAKYVKVSEDDVKKAYQQATSGPSDQRIRSVFYLPESARVYGIITKDKNKIQQAKKQLDNGIAFGVVAEQFSEDDRTKKRRGEIGWIERPDAVRKANPQVPPQIFDVAFKTKAGQTSAPFQAGSDWVILRIEEHRDARMQPYDHVKSVIRDRLLQAGAANNKKVQDRFAKLRKDAKVEVNLPGYKELFADFEKQIQAQPIGVTPKEGDTPGGTGIVEPN